LIDCALERHFKTSHQPIPAIYQALDYSVVDGGKRFRPILTLAVGELFGAQRTALLPFASAIELIHCYSLIHDDLPALDNDDMRRGKPSCHRRFGEAIALLAGDALLTEAFSIISNAKVTRLLGGSVTVKLIQEITEAAGIRGMIGGQSMELELGKNQVTAAILEDMDRLKTGALITAAARLGAMIGRASRSDLDRITRYARSLGLAFQITDDALDAHEVSSDGDNNKRIANYLCVAGRAGAMKRVKVLLTECLTQMEPYGKAAQPLREIAHYVVERKN
jgi:geranylgeranyl diphosphate synthase type II